MPSFADEKPHGEGDNRRFPSSTSATERERSGFVSSRSHKERERERENRPFVCEPQRETISFRLSPMETWSFAGKSKNHGGRENRLLGKVGGEVSRERENEPKQTVDALPLSSSFAYTCLSNTVSTLPQLSDVSNVYCVFDLILMHN